MYTFNPNTKIESAKVNANFAGLADGTLDDDNNSLALFRNEATYDFVASGCIWTGDSYGSTRVASMTSGVVYINGARIEVGAVSSRTFTASKDTYVDIDSNGTITYTEVANSASSPALASDSIRLAIIVTGASTIANQYSINQGQTAATTATVRLPYITGNGHAIVDSNGVLICPRDPARRIVSQASRSSASSTGQTGTNVAYNGMPWLVFQAEANTNYKFIFHEPVFSGFGGTGFFVLGAFLATAANTETTAIGDPHTTTPATATGINYVIYFNSGTYSGKTYLNIRYRSGGITGTTTINSDTTRTGIFTIERLHN